MAPRADAHIARRASPQDQPRRLDIAPRQSLERVAAQVQHGLNDVVRIDRERRQARVVVAVDGDALGRFTAQQMINTLE